jgi:hypothetical protein
LHLELGRGAGLRRRRQVVRAAHASGRRNAKGVSCGRLRCRRAAGQRAGGGGAPANLLPPRYELSSEMPATPRRVLSWMWGAAPAQGRRGWAELPRRRWADSPPALSLRDRLRFMSSAETPEYLLRVACAFSRVSEILAASPSSCGDAGGVWACWPATGRRGANASPAPASCSCAAR